MHRLFQADLIFHMKHCQKLNFFPYDTAVDKEDSLFLRMGLGSIDNSYE